MQVWNSLEKPLSFLLASGKILKQLKHTLLAVVTSFHFSAFWYFHRIKQARRTRRGLVLHIYVESLFWNYWVAGRIVLCSLRSFFLLLCLRCCQRYVVFNHSSCCMSFAWLAACSQGAFLSNSISLTAIIKRFLKFLLCLCECQINNYWGEPERAPH